MIEQLPHPRPGAILAFLAVLLLATSAALAQDMTFVQIPGVPGESIDAAHVDWIDAYALDQGASFTAGVGPAFSDVAFLKGTDKATPKLFRKVADASVLGTVVVEVCRVGPPQECYYRLELENARLVSVDLAGSSCVDPATSCTPSQTESVALKYDRITWIYTEWVNGSPAGNVEECWDIVAGHPC